MRINKEYPDFIDQWYKKYKRMGGKHHLEEYIRFLDILFGLMKTMYGKNFLSNIAEINFGELLVKDESYKYWVDYIGSIKEAKIYICSIY